MGFVLPPFKDMSIKELKDQIRTLGKRAQSRIKTLAKAFGERGKFYGDKSYILDTYGDFDTKVKGKTKNQLYAQLNQAYSILNAKTSTVKGYSTWLKNKRDSFVSHHPDLKDETGKNFDASRYDRAMKLLGRIQEAEKSADYDSDEQVALAYKYVDRSETAQDQLIDDIINKETSTEAEWKRLNFDEQRKYIAVYEDKPQEKGDQDNIKAHTNVHGASVATEKANSGKLKSGANKKRGKR